MAQDEKTGAKAPVSGRGKGKPVTAARPKHADAASGTPVAPKTRAKRAPAPALPGEVKAVKVSETGAVAAASPVARGAVPASSGASSAAPEPGKVKATLASRREPVAPSPFASTGDKPATAAKAPPKTAERLAPAPPIPEQAAKTAPETAERPAPAPPVPEHAANTAAPMPETTEARTDRALAWEGRPAAAAPPTAAPLPSAAPAQSAATLRREEAEALHRTVGSRAAAAHGFAEINSKMLDLMRAQVESAYEIWRATVSARSFPEAIQAQANGMRKAFETTAACWRDLAETMTRAGVEAAKPVQDTFKAGPRR